MLDIGLCMTVKDEAANIADCLAPIVDLFAQVIIIDTGSTDGTLDLLRSRFGIEPIRMELDETACFALSSVRNQGFDQLETSWIMTLDADERIERAALQAVIALDDCDLPDGLLCGWDTDLGDGQLIEDYKLCLFRSAHRHQGLVHDTVQPSVRQAGGSAVWSSDLRLRHYPDATRREAKDERYAWRLGCARARHPDWLRYDWFAGYMAYRQRRHDSARFLLEQVHEERPDLFPVESLNASMVLAAIHAEAGCRDATLRVLDAMQAYHARVADDFEVRVNHRLPGWIIAAQERAERGEMEAVRPYAFAF